MLEDRIKVAHGEKNADLVFKNAAIVNVFTEEIEYGDVAIQDGMIVGIGEYSGINEIDCSNKFIAPGFIDGHIHIESAMMSPVEFTKAVLPRGTTSVVADPHEIANVCGIKGIEYMLSATKNLPLEVYITLPSCVPSTIFDESGATLSAFDLEPLYQQNRVVGLAEVMDSVGTINRDKEILQKISDSVKYKKVVDGHAPGTSGKDLCAYVTAGVQSDHECVNAKEAKERIKRGQWVMIREGTAAKNLDELMPLFEAPYHQKAMLVTDDKHPSDLISSGHIDYIIKRAVSNGANPCKAIKMATLNAAEYFDLHNVGAIAPNYKADLVILSDLKEFQVEEVYKQGRLVAKDGIAVNTQVPSIAPDVTENVKNSFRIKEIREEDFLISVNEDKKKIRIISLQSGQILTDEEFDDYVPENNGINLEKDIIKLTVFERHHLTGHKGIGYIKGYGLKKGAIASSVAHDSHNLIVVGTNSKDMCIAANCIRKMQGGLAVVSDGEILGQLALPIAGLMSELDAHTLMKEIRHLKEIARKLGVSENVDPFMTLAFTSLPVIPKLKLTTLGLVDTIKQQIVDVIL